jgi:two-component system NtrC family sensor kinase
MNPSSTLRVRRAIALAFFIWGAASIILSLAVFGEGASNYVSFPFVDTRLGGSAVVAAVSREASEVLTPGDFLLEVDGTPYFEVLARVDEFIVEGEPNRYLIGDSDGGTHQVELWPQPIAWALSPKIKLAHAGLMLVALIYLVTGSAAFFLKPDRSDAFALLLFCSAMAVVLTTILGTDLVFLGWPRLAINTPLVAATTFHLFTSYPIEPDWIVRHRRIQWVPYGFAAVFAFLTLCEMPLGLPTGLGLSLAFTSIWVSFLVSLGIAAYERRRARDGPVRDRADLMFLAAVVSFLPIGVIFVAEWVLRAPFPYWLALLWAFVFPVAVGYGIVRRQLFEIRLFAKSSATYGAATLAITGVFAFLITFADAAVRQLDTSVRWFEISFLFLAILAFNPLRNRLQSLVDRVFDRDRETYRVAVREISEAMVSMLSLSEIAERILLALTETMGVERAMVMMVDDDGRTLRPTAVRGEWEEEAEEVEVPADHAIWKHLWMRREDLSREDFDDEPDVESRDACRDVFDTLEVELLVPILYGVDLLGVIAVGRKLSGESLVADDRMLLRTLANQSSIAIENAKAFDEIAKLNETLEARVDERTRELRETQAQLTQAEKMKSLGQLVAGVAHELNNPIGFVHANLQLLDEFVTKLIASESQADTDKARDAIEKLLSRSKEGTERVKKIVQDLRTFSRMDQAELQDADLNEELERTLALMEPRFKNAIEVERDFGELPAVRCYPGQLNQVFLNLLMNACDALGKRGHIRVRTRAQPDGVKLEFSDDGPGIPEDVKSRIFDPFFTTKPVGVGTGLGLSLSHGIVERHGGRILVESEHGAGTKFTLELPLVAQELAEGERAAG